MFDALFGAAAGSAGKQEEEKDIEDGGAGLLDEWNKCSHGDAGDEAAASKGRMDNGAAKAEAASSGAGEDGGAGDVLGSIGRTITGGVMSTGVGGLLKTTSQTLSDVNDAMPSRTTVTTATVLLCFGGFQLMLAVFVFLPMIVLTPQKFALSFTSGSACVFVAGLMLRGWKSQLKQMVSKERLPFTGGAPARARLPSHPRDAGRARRRARETRGLRPAPSG